MKKTTIKTAFYKFKPESCVFVVSVNKNKTPSGMIAGWNMKCSIEPPLFAVALSKKGNTHKLIQDSKEFVVAIPSQKLVKELEYFGSVSGVQFDKFKETGIKTKKAEFIKSPLILDATINFECKLYKEIKSGDK